MPSLPETDLLARRKTSGATPPPRARGSADPAAGPLPAVDCGSAAFSPAIWAEASRRLLAKLIEEFAYEKILDIAHDPATGRCSALISADLSYGFTGRRYVFDNWSIDPQSLTRSVRGETSAAQDPLLFCVEALPALGVKPMTAAHFLRELGNTLLADAHILAGARATGAELAVMDDARLEGETTGHPWITVSKGRLGLGYDDYLAFAPESRQDLRVLWIGVDSGRAGFAAIPGLTNEALARDALGEARYEEFCGVLADKAGERGDAGRTHHMMPVHPWQWERFVVSHFASDIAAGDIIFLGEGDDLYRPQQSVRTLSNVSNPKKSTLKLCMTMLNTAVYRGIPGKRALAAAPLTAWLDDLVAADSFLAGECRLVLLGERAGMHYAHPLFSRIEGAPYQFNEMLGCLWRDSLAAHLGEGESGVPLAALLHAGSDGVPVAAALAERSGRSLEDWVERFLEVLLPPVIHLLARYGLGFSAHGQNATLVLKGGWPERLALRDFIDDVNVCDEDFPEAASMPQVLKPILLRLPPEFMRHFVQTTLFVCVLRYVSVLLDRRCDFSQERFWRAARRVVEGYQARFPELRERFALFDLFGERYPRLCLNRVRLFTHGYADDDERPVPDFAGDVRNPLTAFP